MKKKLPLFSRNVLFLSLVSFFNDIGGEPIKKIIPLYLSGLAGVPPSFLGLLEGIAESVPQLFQPLAGYFSDKFRKRKRFIIIGQVLRTCILILSVTTTWFQIIIVRFLDRSGKGIANAPRDALVSESSKSSNVGRSFGLTRAFDNAGAVFGFLFSALLLFVLGIQTDITKIIFQYFIIAAVIPLCIALFIVVFQIKDVGIKRIRTVSSQKLPYKYWFLLFVVLIFTLGNSSDAFLILKAKEQGITIPYLFLFLAFYSGTSSILGYFFSSLSDQIGRKKIIFLGWCFFVIVYALFPIAKSIQSITTLFFFYGMYLGLTEGVIKAWISDIVPIDKKATAYGVFHMATGIMLLPASILTGILWQFFGLSTALYVDAGIVIIASLLLIFV